MLLPLALPLLVLLGAFAGLPSLGTPQHRQRAAAEVGSGF